MSHIPEEFLETAIKCLFELLLQPENFRLRQKNNHFSVVKRFFKTSLESVPPKFMSSEEDCSTKGRPSEDSFLFHDKFEFFEFIKRQDKLEKKLQKSLQMVKGWGGEDQEKGRAVDLFAEEKVVDLPAGQANIVEEIRRTVEKTDKFEEVPLRQDDLDLSAEIERLNFGGMPVDPHCLGQPVRV